MGDQTAEQSSEEAVTWKMNLGTHIGCDGNEHENFPIGEDKEIHCICTWVSTCITWWNTMATTLVDLGHQKIHSLFDWSCF